MAKAEMPPIHPWLAASLECGQRLGSFFSVAYASYQWEAWRDYFERIGYMPVMFRKMTHGDAWTAPAQWPSMLDFVPSGFERTYVPHLVAEQRVRLRPTDAELDAQFARLGLSRLRPGSKSNVRPQRHGSEERWEAQEILDRYAREAGQ